MAQDVSQVHLLGEFGSHGCAAPAKECRRQLM
jgi:hypothetical protein